MALKSEVIARAYTQMRISGLTVNPTPEDVAVAMARLEDMAAEFEDRNICLNYNFTQDPDPNDESGLSAGTLHAVSTNLAIRLMPDFNTTVNPILSGQARAGLSVLSAISAKESVRPVAYSTRMARGSGSTLRYNRYQRFFRPDTGAPNDCKTNNMIIGDVDDFVESFVSYLKAGEIIQSFTIEATDGLTIESSSNTDTDVSYRIKAVSASGGQAQTVTIVMTTDNGRIETRIVYFSITGSN